MAAGQAGGDRDERLPKDWRFWGQGGHSEGVRLRRRFSICSRVLSSDLPLAHSFSSIQTSPPWGLVPNP